MGFFQRKKCALAQKKVGKDGSKVCMCHCNTLLVHMGESWASELWKIKQARLKEKPIKKQKKHALIDSCNEWFSHFIIVKCLFLKVNYGVISFIDSKQLCYMPVILWLCSFDFCGCWFISIHRLSSSLSDRQTHVVYQIFY